MVVKPPASWDRLAEYKIRECALLKSCCPRHCFTPRSPLSLALKKRRFVWLPSGQRGSTAARQVDWLCSPYYLISCDQSFTPLFLLQEHVLWWLYILNGPYDLIVFRVNLEWQIQLNAVAWSASWKASEEGVLTVCLGFFSSFRTRNCINTKPRNGQRKYKTHV